MLLWARLVDLVSWAGVRVSKGVAYGCFLGPRSWVLGPGWYSMLSSMGSATPAVRLLGRRDERAAKAVRPWYSVVLWHTRIPTGQDMNV